MTESNFEDQERLRARIEDMITRVMRADETAIIATVATAIEQGQLDDPTAQLLANSRRLLLATTVGLSAAIELHRLRYPAPGVPATCLTCRTEGRCRTTRKIADTIAAYLPGPVTLSRAEAWRRADAHFRAATGIDILVSVREIPDAYVTWATPAGKPGQDPTPTPYRIIVDKRTGILTKWPALPIDELAEQYHRYALGLPLGTKREDIE